MKCPHCAKEFHFEEFRSWTFKYDEPPDETVTGYDVVCTFCPACDEMIVLMRDGIYNSKEGSFGREWLTEIRNEQLLYPKGALRPVSEEVPEEYASDYREAVAVLALSPKASAAMSRRILQQLLREKCGIAPSSLAKEIGEFTSRSGIPSYLSDAVDAVRNVGNFAAHPLKDTNTGSIVDVENGEADWLLDVLDAMFDYVFVQPSRLEKRRTSLNAKLRSMGKPVMGESRTDTTETKRAKPDEQGSEAKKA